MMDYDIIGAIKIKDGLFLGDEYAAQDLEFIVTNKVTRIINCAAKQIPNHWEAVEVQYLSYGWLETDSQVIFDNKGEVLNATYNLIEETIENAESILVHSIRGQNRSVSIIAAYLMKKYRWSLYKTLEFIHSRRQDLEIKASFFNQLLNLESKLTKQGFGAKSFNWKELSGERHIDNEEFLITNTFLNAKIGYEEEDENSPKEGDEQNNSQSEINQKKKKDQKENKDQVEEIPFDLKKPEQIEDFDLNSFDGDSDTEDKQKEKKKNNDKKNNDASAKEEKNKQQAEVKQSSNKIRKIVWTDEDGNKSICSLEIPPFEKCQFKRKIAPQKQQSFYRSILKGSNKVFQTKQNKNEISEEKPESSGIINNTNQSSLTNISSANTSGGGFRKIGNLKSTLRSKNPEDAQQEKKIIMQKITNVQKDVSSAEFDSKSLSATNIINDDTTSSSLNAISNKQLKEVMAKYDLPLQEEENSKQNETEKNKQPSGLKDKRRKITKKEFQQLVYESKVQPYNAFDEPNQQQQDKINNGGDLSNSTKARLQMGNSLGSKGFDQFDDEFGFGFSKTSSNGFSKLNNISNIPISSGMMGSSSTKDLGMSSKNFFNNQNIYPSSTGNGSNSSNPPLFTIKNSFKSTQKIYQNGVVKPKANSFIMGQGRNTPELGFQIQKLGSRVYSDEKKFSRTAKVYGRPSTAPMKQNPYQRIIFGNQIKPPSSQQSSTPVYQQQQQQYQQQLQQLQQQQQQQQQQQFQLQQVPLQQFQANIPQQRRSSLVRNENEESGRKSLRSSSAGSKNDPVRQHQFGFFQSHKPRWKF